MLEKKEQKPLWTLCECSFDISPKIASSEWVKIHSWSTGILWIDGKEDRKLIFWKHVLLHEILRLSFELVRDRCNLSAIFPWNYNVFTSLQVYWGLARDLQQSAIPTKINVAAAKQVVPTRLKLTLPWWRGYQPRSFYPSASTRRAQLSVEAKVFRPTDLLNNVKYWFITD